MCCNLVYLHNINRLGLLEHKFMRILCDLCLLFKELVPGFLQFIGFTVTSFRAANYYANKDMGGYELWV